MWRKLSLGLVGSIFAACNLQVASAADIPAPVYKAQIAVANYNWTGWYVGLNAGGAFGRTDANTSTVFSPTGYFALSSVPAIGSAGAQRVNSSGLIVGGQVGYNLQTNNIVWGIETDFQYFGLRGSSTGGAVYPCCAPTAFTVNSQFNTDWLFTARPRVGLAANNWLFYVTGGVALANLKGNFTFTDTFATANETASVSKVKAGWTVGAGAEYALLNRWSVKAEYLYVDLGSVSTTSTNLTAFTPAIAFPTNTFTHSVNLQSHIFRLGLNYKL